MKAWGLAIIAVALLTEPVAKPNCTVLAQTDVDVAAAARANRARVQPDSAQSEWYNATRVSMHAQDHGDSVQTIYEFGTNHELRITMQETEKGKQQTSEVMLINGQCQWMLAKGVPLEKGYEIDALDAPVLQMKVLLELLRRAVPGGPDEVKEKQTVNVHELSRSIAVSTASASGGIEAPWTLQGTIEVSAPGQVSFDLTVKQGQAMRFSGTWEKAAVATTFDDNMSLEGWQILFIGPVKKTDDSGTILDYGAQRAAVHANTLGELRSMNRY